MSEVAVVAEIAAVAGDPAPLPDSKSSAQERPATPSLVVDMDGGDGSAKAKPRKSKLASAAQGSASPSGPSLNISTVASSSAQSPASPRRRGATIAVGGGGNMQKVNSLVDVRSVVSLSIDQSTANVYAILESLEKRAPSVSAATSMQAAVVVRELQKLVRKISDVIHA